jgi:hypothetical protein
VESRDVGEAGVVDYDGLDARTHCMCLEAGRPYVASLELPGGGGAVSGPDLFGPNGELVPTNDANLNAKTVEWRFTPMLAGGHMLVLAVLGGGGDSQDYALTVSASE